MSGLSRFLNPNKASGSLNLVGSLVVQQQQVRGSHARTMFIRPGKFYTKKFLDILHFNFFLAAAPFLAFIGYQNFFVGPGVLTEIPEDYEPRHWEYVRSPVKRWMAKNVHKAPEKAYECTLNNLYVEQCRVKMRMLEAKVRRLMLEKQDYKAWYYVPVQKETAELQREALEKFGPATSGYGRVAGGK